jgi:hypothetical protein
LLGCLKSFSGVQGDCSQPHHFHSPFIPALTQLLIK